MPGMLYYPGMTPPDDVLNHAALYWDTVSTIAPVEFERHLRPSLRLARESGVYQPVSTRNEHDFNHSFHQSFTQGLVKVSVTVGNRRAWWFVALGGLAARRRVSRAGD